MLAQLGLILALPLAAQAAADRTIARDWVALDVFHLSRTLPALDRVVDAPLNPGFRLSHHHAWFGRRLSGGTTLQTSFSSFDELFWSVSVGAGFEGVWRPEWGLYAGLGLGLDYARSFTGRNDFEFEDGRYRQATDSGRGFLRVTLADLRVGYSPAPMRRFGLYPALRYAWLVELPLYSNDDANPWSYTEFGPSLVWIWKG